MKFDKNLNAYVSDEKTKQFFAEWDMQIYEHQAERRGILKIAKNMLLENVPLTTIIKCTGLSQEEILKLQ